ncbi:Sas10 C-terminal domain-containing protein [Cunninghamella echinulata]|nr:Sas10 C-terminal domain-containing protein [Cunninghamella echinulata]
MGKKRGVVFRDGSKKTRNDEGKINAINTWDDIDHDSEDEFHDARGNILLENQDSDQDGQISDHEIYGLDGIDEEDIDESSEEEDEEQEDEVEETTWGQSKKAYYNADEGSDLDEMREEEEEALKIQKQRLANMDEADFVDDALAGWGLGADANKDTDKQLLESVTKDLDDITFDVSATVATHRKNLPLAEKLKILQNESPELMDLMNEFKDKTEALSLLHGIILRINKNQKNDHQAAKFIIFQYQLFLNYLTNVSFYFSLKASGTPDIREHPCINALVELRATIEKTEKLETKIKPQLETFLENLDKPDTLIKDNNNTMKTKKISNKTKPANKKSSEIQQPTYNEYEDEDEFLGFDDDDEDNQGEEEDEETVPDIEQEFKSLKKQVKKRKRALANDFGDFDAMEEVDMEDKIMKKRSIRDYVAKIESKQAKQQAKYQGDSDLPYRDRKNQQQKKGVAQPQDTSADLDDKDWDEQDIHDSKEGGYDDEDDYTAIVKEKKSRKAMKQAAYDAERAPLVDGDYKVDDGEKRLASRQILKNRGLTPHRKKENRNGRVKKRRQYDQKLKKLSSVRHIAKPLQGTYGGEFTGIKANVSRSVKL